ncbi:MAG: tetratricopeptide repeat protein [Elusimicrobiota bacterium]
MSSKRPRFTWLACAFVALAAFAAFLPALSGEFVNWDDNVFLYENPFYRGFAWENLKWMFTTLRSGTYQPLAWLTYALDFKLWGMDPSGYHLTNLLLHALNAALLLLVCLELLPLPRGDILPASALCALLFAVHPLRVESVAWATERRDVLSGAFYLLALLFYLRSAASKSRPMLLLSLTAYACSLLSKAMGVTLPLVLLMLDAYPLRRLSRRSLLEKLPYLLPAVIVSVVAWLGQTHAGAAKSIEQYGLIERLAQTAYGLAFYLRKTLWPTGLSALYLIPSPFDPLAPAFLLSAAAVLVVTLLALRLRRSHPALLTAWGCYVVTVLPVLGPLQSGDQLAADRYSYLACIPWAVLAAAHVFTVFPRNTVRHLIRGAVAFCCLALFVLTWRQTRVWHDSETLWTHALRVDPENAMAHVNLAAVLAQRGDIAAAMDLSRQALRIRPLFPIAHASIAGYLESTGRLDEAIRHYRMAAASNPDNSWVQSRLAGLLLQRGDEREAREHLRKATEKGLDIRLPQLDAAAEEAMRTRFAPLVEEARSSVRKTPRDAQKHVELGAAYAQQGSWREAVREYEQALKLDPDHADAHNNIGSALASLSRFDEASEHFRRTLELRPADAEAHFNLANILTIQGRLEEAADHFETAALIDPGMSKAKQNAELLRTHLEQKKTP